MKLIFPLIFLTTFLFISCGKDQSANPFVPEKDIKVIRITEAESYRYHLTLSRCDTGEQSAPTMKELCQILLDDELNNFCAREKREELFEGQNCQSYI